MHRTSAPSDDHKEEADAPAAPLHFAAAARGEVPPPRRRGLWQPERGWTWVVLFVAVAGLLFFRQPIAIRHPTFVAEDGAIFFKQAYERGAFSVLLLPHAGYLQVVPRLAAAVASWFPLWLMPATYSVISLLVAAGVFTFFYAANFRSVIASDATRVGVILLLTVMPNTDPLMRVAALPWYMLWLIILVTLMELPRSAWGRGLLFGAVTLAVWSTPVAVVCLPLVLFRLWRAGARAERLWWGATLLSMIGYVLTAESGAALSSVLRQPGVVLSIIHGIGYRVFCYFFLGYTLSRPLPETVGWEVITRLSLLLAAGCALAAVGATVSAWRRQQQRQLPSVATIIGGVAPWTSLVVLYLILTLPTLFVLRPPIVPDFLGANIDTCTAHQRYFYCSTLLLCVLGGIVYDGLLRAPLRRAGAFAQAGVVVLLLGWISLHTPAYVQWDWSSRPSWKHFTREIRAAEARVKATGGREVVHISTAVDIWAIDLVVEAKKTPSAGSGKP